MKRRPSLNSTGSNNSRRPSVNSNCSNHSDTDLDASSSNLKSGGLSSWGLNRGKIVRIESSLSLITYRLNFEVGRGAVSVVYRGTNVEDESDFVAVKRYSLAYYIDKDKESCLNAIESEIVLLKSLDHPNVVKYIGTSIGTNNIYIVLEYMANGSLASLVKLKCGLAENSIAYFIDQILLGLIYLHEKGIIHRDIKGANILISRNNVVKLADFSAALNLGKTMREGEEVAGSPYWMAPEVIDMKLITPACDIWALGCTIVEMVLGRPPLYDVEPVAALFLIVREAPPPPPQGVSALLADFLGQCLRKNPDERVTAAVLVVHPFLLCKQNPPDQPYLVDEQTTSTYKSDQGVASPCQEFCMPSRLPAFDLSTDTRSYCDIM